MQRKLAVCEVMMLEDRWTWHPLTTSRSAGKKQKQNTKQQSTKTKTKNKKQKTKNSLSLVSNDAGEGRLPSLRVL